MDQDKKSSLLRSNILGEALNGVKRFFLIAIAANIITTAFAYINPLIITTTIDKILADIPLGNDFLSSLIRTFKEQSTMNALLFMAALIIFTTIVGGTFSFVRGKFITHAGEGLSMRLRNRLYAHLQAVPYSYHTNSQTGDLVQRCTSDVDMVRRFAQMQALELVRTVVMAVVAFTIMLPISAKMTVISVSLLPIILGFSFVYFKNVQRQFTKVDEAEGALSTIVQENLTGVRVVRAFAQERAELDKFTAGSQKFYNATIKLNKMMGIYWGLSDTIGYMQIAISLACGAFFAASGELSVGHVVLFTTYTSMITFPMRQLGRILADLGKAKVSLSRLEDILCAPLETEPGKAEKPSIIGNISFKNVSFDYGDGISVLKNVSFDVKCGQTIGILGSTGSGKSSLVQLLQRLHPVTDGCITIDDVNIVDIERHHLRGNIGIVLQEPFLYSRTIGENIAMAKPSATLQEIKSVAAIACVHDVIEGFEHGYDTIVGERGVTLSGGQKQRVAIARMLLQNTPILVFDDSLSAVDAQTDVAIRTALLKREHGTMFIISHRISTLQNADFIIVLDNGELVQSGTHKELSQTDGLYRRVCQLQNQADSLEEGGR